MKIDSIQNGIVLDHISAGNALRIYYDLGWRKVTIAPEVLGKKARDCA